MKKTPNSDSDMSQLRQRAEKRLVKKFPEVQTVSTLNREDVESLVHELRVYEIELEMQNEELRTAQERLRELKDQYLDLYEFAPIGYLTTNMEGIILEANLTVVGLLSEVRENLIRSPFFRFITSQDVDTYYFHLKKVLETQEQQSCEIRLVRRNGHEFYVQLDSVPVQDKDGQFHRYRTTVIDITQRKVAEQQLRETEEKYRLLFSNEKDAVVVHDVESLKFVDVNPAAESLWGYTRKELLEMTPVDLGFEPNETYEAFQQATKQGGTQVSMRWQRRKDGSAVAVEISASQPYTWKGKRLVCSIIRDITDRMIAEKTLRESEDRYRQLADVTFEAIAFHDDGLLLHANDQFFQMFGYEPEELIGIQRIDKLITSESAVLLTNSIALASPDSYEAIGVRKDGREFPVEVRVRLRTTEMGQIRVIAIRDISERKDMEKRLIEIQKMEAVGTLAGGIAHDFNNLLQIIGGHAEMLEMELESREMKFAEMDAIRQAADRGADLVKQILTFSRKIEATFKAIDTNEEIKKTERLLNRTIPKMIEIDLRLEKNLKPIKADPSQIEQMLINIAVNAADAMPEGGKLTIETNNVDLDEQFCEAPTECIPGSYVRLRISDNGLGINPSDKERIFEPFFTTKGVGKGTGLGLSTVFGIIKMHNGFINCESELGKGTSFQIYFPVTESETVRKQQKVLSRPHGGSETILVVDDEELIRTLAKTLLQQAGYQVIMAATGREAIDLYRHNQDRIALVILDLIMPEMGGNQCLQELMKINPHVKVLIASGYALDAESAKHMQTSSKGIVSKPFNMRELLSSIRKVLDEPD